MTDVNIFYFQLTGKTLMSEPIDRWSKAESLLAEGKDAETIALMLVE